MELRSPLRERMLRHCPLELLTKYVSLKTLDAIAAKQTDNESARLMQDAKDKLFKKLGAEAAGSWLDNLSSHRSSK